MTFNDSVAGSSTIEVTNLNFLHSVKSNEASRDQSSTGEVSNIVILYPVKSNEASVEEDQTIEAHVMATESELTDAKLKTAAAETDTKIVRLEGKLDLVLSKLDGVNENTLAVRRDVKDSERSIKANAYVLAGAILALIIGIITVIPFVFDLGMKNRETISRDVEEKVKSIQAPAVPVRPQQPNSQK